MKRIILFFMLLVLSSCSPFGNQSIIKGIGSAIENIFKGQSTNEIISGGTTIVETNPSTPSQNYKATVSIGGQFSQNAVETTSGYKVYVSIQSQ